MLDTAIVVMEKRLGLFVGAHDGRALWSRIDAEGETCVVTFSSEEDARRQLQRLLGAGHPACYRFVTVYPDAEYDYASVRALIRAGLFFELGTLVPTGAADPEFSSDRS